MMEDMSKGLQPEVLIDRIIVLVFVTCLRKWTVRGCNCAAVQHRISINTVCSEFAPAQTMVL